MQSGLRLLIISVTDRAREGVRYSELSDKEKKVADILIKQKKIHATPLRNNDWLLNK